MLVEQSARDLIIGGLLAVDELVRRLDTDDQAGDDRQWSVDSARLKEVVECLCLDGAGPMRRTGGRLGYGIPGWLIDPMPPASVSAHGLGALLARNLHGGGARWSRLFTELDDDAWLTDLYRLQSELEQNAPIRSDRPVRDLPLAAATGTRRALAGPDQVADPLGYDQILRAIRSDIALVHPTAPHGILLGLAITDHGAPDNCSGERPNAPRIDGRFLDDWSPYTPRFTQGVDAGRRLALDLLTDLGVADQQLEPWRGVRFQVLGLLPPVRVDEESAGLAASMHVLSAVTALPSPGELGVVCTGSVERGGFQPVSEGQLAQKIEAVRRDGRHGELLYPSAGGWRRRSVSDVSDESNVSVAPEEDVHSGPLTLAEAAEMLWGRQWRHWLDEQHMVAVQAAGWRRWEPRTKHLGGAIPVVRRAEVGPVTDVFRDGHPTAVVLGGPANSGKTTVAACIGDRLAGDGWQVIGLVSESHELDEPGQLGTVVAHALPPDPVAGRKTLVVLDGLWPTGRQDLGAALEALCERLKISVLVTARFDDPAREWDTASVQSVPLFVDARTRQEFAEQITAQQPELAGLRPAAGVLAKAAGPDLWMLTQLMKWAAAHAGSPQAAAEELRASFLADRVAQFSADERYRIGKLAAASLVATGLTDAELGVGRGKLIALGARHDGEVWTLPSSVLCRLLLSESAGRWSSDQIEQQVLALSRGRLHSLVAAGDGVRIMKLLMGGAGFSERVFTQLIRACQQELVAWARFAEPVLIARMVRQADVELGPEVCTDLVRRICRLLPASRTSAVELTECLRVVNRYRHVAEADGSFAQLVSGLRDAGLRLSLQLNASPSARLEVLRQLDRFHHPELARLILLNLPNALQGLSPVKPDDYLTVRRAEDLRQRVTMELAEDGQPVPVMEALTDLPGVAALLGRKPGRTDGIALFINALILRIVFDREDDDWDGIAEIYRTVLHYSLGHSRLGEQVRAFHNLADYQRVLCVRLLNQPELPAYLGRQMESAQPTELSFLLRTLAKLHGRFARDLLYEADDTPKEYLVRQMADKLVKLGDGKGAGMVLAAAAAIDDLYGSRGHGFAHRLAEQLGVNFAEAFVQTDQRPAVLAHFLRGLWSAGAEYADQVTERIEEVSARWLVGSHRVWPARLALLLGVDDRSGESFLTSLAGRIDDATLLDRMLNTRTAEALSIYHQLGRALFPGLPVRFSREFDAMPLDSILATSRTVSFLRCCSDIRDTLIAAGVPNAGHHVLDKAGWPGAEALVRVYSPGDLAESLRLLAKLDPTRAAAAVDNLSEERSAYRSDRSFLEHQVRRALPHPSMAVELLAAIEAVRPGAGAGILRKVRSASGAWHAFGVELAHNQDPREQARVVLALTRQGLHRGQPGTGWLDTLAQKWLQTLPGVRSPHAVADLIRMVLVWDPKTCAAIADAVNVSRLAGRLAEGAAGDLQCAWRLLAAFVVAGRADLAATVSQALDSLGAAPVMRACGLTDGSRLVRVLRAVDPGAAVRYADPLAEMIDRAIARRHVVDRQRHWLDIGWAANALAELSGSGPHGSAPAGTVPPPVRPDALNPGVSLWGMTWLSGDWTETSRTRAMDAIANNDPPQLPSAAAAVLIAEVRHGGLDLRDPQEWSHVAEASFGHLTVLHMYGSGHPSVEPVLRLIRERVRRRANEPTARADFAAYQLRRLI